MEKGPSTIQDQNRWYHERQDEDEGDGRGIKQEQCEGHNEEEHRQDGCGDQGCVSSFPKLPELGLVSLLSGHFKPRTPLEPESCLEGLDAQEPLGKVPPLVANRPHAVVPRKVFVLLKIDLLAPLQRRNTQPVVYC